MDFGDDDLFAVFDSNSSKIQKSGLAAEKIDDESQERKLITNFRVTAKE